MTKRSKQWLGKIIGGYFIVIAVVVGSLYVVSRLRGVQPAAVSQPHNNFTRFLPFSQTRADASSVTLVPTWAPTLGNANAAITIVEFGDFQCPFCRASAGTVQQLLASHPQDVRLVFRQLPITAVHPLAQQLAEASLCAHDQGKFWPLHDKLYQQQDSVTADTILDVAVSAGLNRGRFDHCLSTHQFAPQVAQDLADAVALGAAGTPTWIINGQKIEGALPFEAWEKIVAELRK